jgi:hypothetical protein
VASDRRVFASRFADAGSRYCISGRTIFDSAHYRSFFKNFKVELELVEGPICKRVYAKIASSATVVTAVSMRSCTPHVVDDCFKLRDPPIGCKSPRLYVSTKKWLAV